MEGGKVWPFFFFQLDLREVASDSESEKSNELPWSMGVLLSCKSRTKSSLWRPMSLASSSVTFHLPFSNDLAQWRLSPPLIWCHPSDYHGGDKHGCWSQHLSNSNSTSVKHLLLLPSPTASSQPTPPCSIHHLSFIIHHQWQLPILSLLNPPCLDFPDIQ